ncbi:protein of unknown function (plasmid) [Agrobacterium pusense]|uniref:Uncharacterized protein n=1 Tax=Agrobacterium pusense TaxID=648995 RepID=U4QEW5_9HYPH|nr:protein of unknown function [Agrobacterium pusense]
MGIYVRFIAQTYFGRLTTSVATAALRISKPFQHPTSGKRVVEMQFLDLPHQGKIAVRHWRQILGHCHS